MILINDLSSRVRSYRREIDAAVSVVLDSGWLILGPQVKRFETLFAEYINVKHCISLANGTDALELALKALGVEAGDQVATVANAGAYTTTALLAIGAIPFFIDVDLQTRNTTLEEVNRAIKAGVKAVVATHLYGLAVPEIRQIAELCASEGVKLLEDCAQAHGALIEGQRVGTFGDASCFSFYPTKNLGALGDGGAVVTNHQEIANRVTSLRQYGWTEKYQVEISGARNSRLDEIQAAILNQFLPLLDEHNAARRAITKQYSLEITHPAVELPTVMGEEYVGHLYVLRSQQRDSLRTHLHALNIASDIHYPIPDYRQVALKAHYPHLSLPNTEILASEILTLPCYPEMTNDQVNEVIAGVNSWK